MIASKYAFQISIGLVFCCLNQTRAQDNPETDWLKRDVGKWKVELKYWPNGQSSDPISFEATETNELLGDHWIISNFEGEFGGMPFKGHGVYGFDVKKNCYVGSWVDSANGFMSRYEGKLNADSKAIELVGQEIDPATGELVDGKRVHTVENDQTRRVDSFQKKEGSDEFVKVMEVLLKKVE